MNDINRVVADSLMCRWAEIRLAFPVGTIVSVKMDQREGREWSDVTVEDPEFNMWGVEATGQAWLINAGDDIGLVIKQLLDMAIGNSHLVKADEGRTPEKFANRMVRYG